ncbi:hypothetical protein N7280_00700 [Rickettsia rhipicephali]|uniref:hypothetical protein n=1 Tax=Rickettsia rhipicephali TaxID=33992 RepID=UPI00225385AE|nr:hypothetical protein [Rickettsia rhipicephali]MCX4079189.1 hypothetical protein [Rickettsia rhipicephali]
MLKTNSPFKAHFKSILDGQIVWAQQAAAYEATKEITKYAEENFYRSFFRCVWLAELSLYCAHRDFHYPKAKGITFDSPGF